ncbi:MAG: enolase C-terminal domain-like protein [Tepidiformaceae bacterium]
MTRRVEAPIDALDVSVYRIPTDQPESDGTLAWDSTTLVIVELAAAGEHGLGFTYADTATATLIRDVLGEVVIGRDALSIEGTWQAMVHAIRNLGRAGIASMAIAAVDVALWDLKAKILDLSLLGLLGGVRNTVPVYGSGGFTSYDVTTLQRQLSGWVDNGIPRVKMKIGTHPDADCDRVGAARQAIGPAAQLFVDANGAYSRKQALEFAERFTAFEVTWFEEPVSSDDLTGLCLIRDQGPAGVDIAAGEYGYTTWYFREMLEAGAVDVLQADASRCAGISGFLKVAALCEAFHLPLSAHCAPSLHAQLGCACQCVRHLEYFHDHTRIEHMLFDGALVPESGELRPDLSRPGLGLQFKHSEAERYAL